MVRAVAVACSLLVACGGDDGDVMFPSNYKSSYVEVRDCRPSSEHDLHKIVVYAPPATAAIYLARTDPFPIDSLIVKEEYDFTDDACAEDLTWWSAMKKTSAGWVFQRVASDRSVIEDTDLERCINCHSACVPPDGFDGTCAVP